MAFTRDGFYVTAFALSWIAGFLPVFLRRRGWDARRAVGLSLVALPFSLLALGFADDVWRAIERYQATGTVFQVLPTAAALALWRQAFTTALWYGAVPLVGLIIVTQDIPTTAGIAPRRSWRGDATRGLSLFFAIGVATLVAFWLQSLLPASARGSDESRYWAQLTVPLIVALSVVPALTEELLFRGVLLRALAARMSWAWAALLQALFFGLIHAGYGSWTHVVAPFAFGLGMAWVAREVGWLAAAVLHAEVNTLFFVLDRWQDYASAHGTLGVLALGGLVAALVVGGAWAIARTRADAYAALWASLRRGPWRV